MLFKSNVLAAGVQRILLRSEVDHVACIVRSEYNWETIYLLEAVGSGVRLIKWNQIREYIGKDPTKFFNSISYR